VRDLVSQTSLEDQLLGSPKGGGEFWEKEKEKKKKKKLRAKKGKQLKVIFCFAFGRKVSSLFASGKTVRLASAFLWPLEHTSLH